ncbi:MAG: hypothetical protein H6Q89_3155 [Myxococcaceae bacterium]|nr:hypothetical protein [Myxococcaceae bacterium]
MSAQYSPDRKVTKTPAVERVSQFDSTARLDLGRQKKFEAALTKAADTVRLEEQRRGHQTFADVAARHSSPKKK